jgi:AraC-like DNA-binding protein
MSALAVPPSLASFVREIRVEDGGEAVSALPYEVLPGPFPVLGLQLRGALAVMEEDRSEPLSSAGVTGLQSTLRRYRAVPGTRTVLVTFQPWGAFPLLGCAMDEIADAHVGLGSLVPRSALAELEERAAGAPSDETLVHALEAFFLHRLAGARPVHPAVAGAAERILDEHGGGRIEEVARDLALSRRQLERLFLGQIGVGPKRLATLARFDWTLRRLTTRISWADLAAEAGYADQAHLVRTFTALAGNPPSRMSHFFKTEPAPLP